MGWVLWRRPAAVRGATVLLAALFLITTPVQPWYATMLVAVGSLAEWPSVAAVASAGYPYFFAVILGYGERVGLGRISYVSAALVVIGAYGVERWLGADQFWVPARIRQESVDGTGSSVVQFRAWSGGLEEDADHSGSSRRAF
jgi:hypothetical protein